MQTQPEGTVRERNPDCEKMLPQQQKRVWTSRLEIINSWKCRYVKWKHISVTSQWCRSLLSGCCSDITAPLGWGDAFYVVFFCVVEQNSCRETQHVSLGNVWLLFLFFHPLVPCSYPVHRWKIYFIYWLLNLLTSITYVAILYKGVVFLFLFFFFYTECFFRRVSAADWWGDGGWW